MENKETAFENVYGPDRRKLTSLSDGKLRTEDGYVFNIHRFVLARKSRYFYALFCGLNTDRRDIVIPGVKGKILDIVLCFIYTGNIDYSEDTLIDLLYVSDYLVYNDLSLKMQEFAIANLSVSNCLQLLAVSVNLGHQRMYTESFRFLQTHFEYVVNEEDNQIEEISLDILKRLLGDRNICVGSENIVWNSIVKWIEFDIVQRQVHVPDLLQCLKVDDMDETLASTIMEHKIVEKNQYCDNLNDFKSLGFYDSDLLILRDFVQAHHGSGLEFNRHRLPPKIHFFMKTFIVENVEFINVHITYDDEIDLWRKVLEFETYCSKFIAIGNRIYLFSERTYDIRSFDFIQNEWIPIEQPERERTDSYVVKHGELIFRLGGYVRDQNEPTAIVEVYDSIVNAWSDVTSMLPVESFQAASLGSKIYVIGHVPESTADVPSMMVQEYDPQSNEWTLIAPPAKYYDRFSLVPHGGRLYIIGGKNNVTIDSKAVEVFDTVVNFWVEFVSVPCEFRKPYAFVLNDRLIVQESNRYRHDPDLLTEPTIYWSEESQRWEPFEESSSLNNLSDYQLFSMDDKESLRVIANENRENISLFVKSPFK